ncbi:MAG: helix-turn-helix domain-containing protein [Acidimicrobiia bacterium]|nr:helix-turn-helix domain-containing protein [Acidimicrobiia bacterium]
MRETDPSEELRRLYPPLLTTAHVAEMMHCTIGDVRDKVHRKELPAVRWGNQFRFFRGEVISVLQRVGDDKPGRSRPIREPDRLDDPGADARKRLENLLVVSKPSCLRKNSRAK